jgi:hypothetical protein
MEAIPVLHGLRELLWIRALQIHEDIDIVKQFTVFPEYLRLHSRKLAHQITKALANGGAFYLDFCLIVRQMTQRLVYVYLYAHLSVLIVHVGAMFAVRVPLDLEFGEFHIEPIVD